MKILCILVFLHISSGEVIINSTLNTNDTDNSGLELRQATTTTATSSIEADNTLVRMREQRNGMLGLYFNPNDPLSKLAALWWTKVFEKPFPTIRPSSHGGHMSQISTMTATTTPGTTQIPSANGETISEKPAIKPVSSANTSMPFPYPTYIPHFTGYPTNPSFPFWPVPYPHQGFPHPQSPIIMLPFSTQPFPQSPHPQLPGNQNQFIPGNIPAPIPSPGTQGQLQPPSMQLPSSSEQFGQSNRPFQSGQSGSQSQSGEAPFPNSMVGNVPNQHGHQQQNQGIESGRPNTPSHPSFPNQGQPGQQNLLNQHGQSSLPGQSGLIQVPPGRPNFQNPTGQIFPVQDRPNFPNGAGQPNFPNFPPQSENRPQQPFPGNGQLQSSQPKPGQHNLPPLQPGQTSSSFQNQMNQWSQFSNQQGQGNPPPNLQNPSQLQGFKPPHKQSTFLTQIKNPVASPLQVLLQSQDPNPLLPNSQPDLVETSFENPPVPILSGNSPYPTTYAQSFTYPDGRESLMHPGINVGNHNESFSEFASTQQPQAYNSPVQNFTETNDNSDSVYVNDATDATEGNQIEREDGEFSPDQKRIELITQGRTSINDDDVRVIPLHSMLLVWRPQTNFTRNKYLFRSINAKKTNQLNFQF